MGKHLQTTMEEMMRRVDILEDKVDSLRLSRALDQLKKKRIEIDYVKQCIRVPADFKMKHQDTLRTIGEVLPYKHNMAETHPWEDHRWLKAGWVMIKGGKVWEK
jgi:hypothetical protein